MTFITSNKRASEAAFRHTIPAGEPYLFEVKRGQTLRLHDLEGNQAVDTLFTAQQIRVNAMTPSVRYVVRIMLI